MCKLTEGVKEVALFWTADLQAASKVHRKEHKQGQQSSGTQPNPQNDFLSSGIS